MELIGKTPDELDRMTLAEIAVAAINAEEADGSTNMSRSDIAAYGRWWNSLTHEEKLFAEE